MRNVEVGNLNELHWLWLVAIVAALALLALVRNRHLAMQFASKEMLRRVFPNHGGRRQFLSLSLVSAALVLLVVCLIDLRWGKVRREVPQKGIEVMFVLDVSRSMLAEDVKPNRLERAKQMIKDTIDEMAGDRIGLAVFAGEVRQRIPLTNHHDDFVQTLDEVGPDDLLRGGSRLGDAIRVATQGFHGKTNKHKAIVLLTDGEDMESEPLAAARQAKEEQGVRIFTIGLGDIQEGAPIPLDDNEDSGFVQHQGQQVWSKLNGEILAQVATETGGAYVPAGTKQVSMSDVYHGYIASLEQAEFETAKINAYEARYQWFCAPAILLLLLEILVTTQPTRPPVAARERASAAPRPSTQRDQAKHDAAWPSLGADPLSLR